MITFWGMDPYVGQGKSTSWDPWAGIECLQGLQQDQCWVGFSSVHFSHSVMSDSLRPPACQAPLSITNSHSSRKPMSIESVMPSNHLILCRSLLFLPSIFPSIRVFSNESVLRIRWPKFWSFSFNVSPSSGHPGLIYFRMDWLDLLAVQGIFKSLLQHHSSKVSVLRRSAMFTVHHPYMTTGKTIALTRQTLVGKVISLINNCLNQPLELREGHGG